MKFFFYGSLLLFVVFCIYVIIVNRNSKNMTLKQKVLKAAYPILVLFPKKSKKSAPMVSKEERIPPVSFYSLKDTLINGRQFNFEQLKGMKILIVNTASDCMYTRQYDDLEELQKKYPEKLLVIGFPSNDFGEQEKADNSSIEKFCKMNYAVSFPLMEKSSVKNSDAQNKVYQWLTDSSKNGWNSKQPEWNFCKYLINEHGELVHYFAPAVSPMDSEILGFIEK